VRGYPGWAFVHDCNVRRISPHCAPSTRDVYQAETRDRAMAYAIAHTDPFLAPGVVTRTMQGEKR